MKLKLSSQGDSQKVFFIKKSELLGRLDPRCYSMKNPFLKSHFPLDIVIKHFFLNPVRFIPKQDVYSFVPMELVSDENACITNYGEIPFESVKGYTPFKEGDFIFAKITPCMENGKMAIAKNIPYQYAYGSTEFHVFRSRHNNIKTEYLHAIFLINEFRKYAKLNFCGSAGQQRVPTDFFKYLVIPVPSIDIQEEIIERIQSTYQKKKQKEAKAKELLDGVNIKLLQDLGVRYQEGKPRSIKERICFCDSRSVSGRRLDPLFHFGQIYGFIEGANCGFLNLSKLTKYMKSGFASGRQEQSRNNEDIIQIRPTNINMNRELVFDRNVYISKDMLDDRKEDVLQENEVLFNNTNSQEQVGKSVLFDLDGQYFCSNHITRIATSAQLLDPQYLTDILNLYQRFQVFYKLCTNWNNQSGIGLDVLGSVKIPVPERVEKQREISRHLKDIRSKAKQLRQEAIAEVERAKAEVEKMILGA